ncbi:9616_t:CDS:2, partial [Racocetra fulgida]
MELSDETESIVVAIDGAVNDGISHRLTIDRAVNEGSNELLNEAITKGYHDGISHRLTIDGAVNEGSNESLNEAMTEGYHDGISHRLTIDGAVNEGSNELLNEAMTEGFHDGISHRFTLDTDSSDEESDFSSLKIKCEWRVNANISKSTLLITFTTVVDKHNHPMVPSPTTNIAKYRKLGDDMVEFIEFCVHHGVTSAQSIGRLLRGKFPGSKVYEKSLYNLIQAAKKKLVTQVEFDASDLMRQLYSQQAEDSRWFVEAKFEKEEQLLDKESEYVRVEEYKEQIPMTGLPTIITTYFNSIEKAVSQYLLPRIVFTEQVNIDYIEGAQEDNYEVPKIYLADIMSTIKQDQI